MRRGDWMALGVAALVVGALAFWPQRSAHEEERAARVAAMADKWSGEIGFESSYDALDPGGGGPTASAPVVAPQGGLPQNEGNELVAAYCTMCHSLQLVMQQRLDARGWNGIIDRMTTHGMPEPEAQERAQIVAYLSRNFGAEAR